MLLLLLTCPPPLALSLQLGAHMLRLHVVLNSPDGVEVLRQPDLAVLTGKAALYTPTVEDTRQANRVSVFWWGRGPGTLRAGGSAGIKHGECC